jgi:hypothetical protein
MPSGWYDARNCFSFDSAIESIRANTELALADLRSTTSSYHCTLKTIIANIRSTIADLRSTPYSSLDYLYLSLLSTCLHLYWEVELAETRRINWLIFRWIAGILFLSDGKSLHILSRRPPPRGRRRSCVSASNPKPRPSIISEYLSRYHTAFCGSSRRLAAHRW